MPSAASGDFGMPVRNTSLRRSEKLSEVRSADRLRRRILHRRRPHQLDVVGHQAIAKYVDAEALAALAEEFEVRTAVVITEENILTVVAALNNVVRLTRNDHSGHARYPDNPPLAGRKVNKHVTVPFILFRFILPSGAGAIAALAQSTPNAQPYGIVFLAIPMGIHFPAVSDCTRYRVS